MRARFVLPSLVSELNFLVEVYPLVSLEGVQLISMLNLCTFPFLSECIRFFGFRSHRMTQALSLLTRMNMRHF